MEGVREDKISRACQKSKRWKLTRLRDIEGGREKEREG